MTARQALRLAATHTAQGRPGHRPSSGQTARPPHQPGAPQTRLRNTNRRPAHAAVRDRSPTGIGPDAKQVQVKPGRAFGRGPRRLRQRACHRHASRPTRPAAPTPAVAAAMIRCVDISVNTGGGAGPPRQASRDCRADDHKHRLFADGGPAARFELAGSRAHSNGGCASQLRARRPWPRITPVSGCADAVASQVTCPSIGHWCGLCLDAAAEGWPEHGAGCR